MMKNKTLALLIAGSLLGITQVRAQNEIDILRYSETNTLATARSIGLGGAGGSLGGDFSSLTINPAGIGVYRRSKLMITPTLRINNAKTNYLDNTTKEHNSKFNVSNVGVLFAHPAKGDNYSKSPWKSWSIGIGYNRQADFNNNFTYSAANDHSSITDLMSADALANGTDQNLVPPLGFLGYQGFLLYDDLTSIPRDRILNQNGSLGQLVNVENSGAVDDWTLSFGGNLQEKLMLGASLDLLNYHYKRHYFFQEEDLTGNTNNDFDYLVYHERLSTSGIGFNMKFGAIYVPNTQFRFGLSFHTPTWSSFTDEADYDLTTNTENLKARTGQSSSDPTTFVQPDQIYAIDYNIRTPWRVVASATAFLGSHGFITADYSYVDYNSMKYSFRRGFENYEHSVNEAIKATYTGAHNIKVGIEGRQKNFMGRLGFAYHTSPFKNDNIFQGDEMDLSVGFGVRFGGVNIDLGYMQLIKKNRDYNYPLQAQSVSADLYSLKQNNNLFALTIGYQF